jgi:hypothetical protein
VLFLPLLVVVLMLLMLFLFFLPGAALDPGDAEFLPPVAVGFVGVLLLLCASSGDSMMDQLDCLSDRV